VYRQNYGGGPVGVETVAAVLGDQRDVVEEVIEPIWSRSAMSSAPRAPGSDRGRLMATWIEAARPPAHSSICSTTPEEEKRHVNAARYARPQAGSSPAFTAFSSASITRYRCTRASSITQLSEIRRNGAHGNVRLFGADTSNGDQADGTAFIVRQRRWIISHPRAGRHGSSSRRG